MTKVLIAFAALAALTSGPIVESCAFLPRGACPGWWLCVKSDGRLC